MTSGPLPEPGSVIRYAYLWADEHARGAAEGRKDRPALALAVSVQVARTACQVLVLAITHTPPLNEADAVTIPDAQGRRIGLDDLPSWIVTTEANAFFWPGPDVRPVPGRLPRTVIYGTVSRSLLQKVAASYLANRSRQRGRMVQRTD